MNRNYHEPPESVRLRDLVTTPNRRDYYLEKGLWNDVTLVQQVRKHAATNPTGIAVVDATGATRVTYSKLDADSNRVANFLVDVGVQVGDVVAVQLPNWYASVAVAVGTLKAGAVINPLLPIYRGVELSHMLAVAQTKVIFTPHEYRGFDHVQLINHLRPKLPYLTTHVVVEADEVDLAGLLIEARDTPSQNRTVEAEWVSELMFTSGTEAEPKAVMHTEQTLNYSVRATWTALGMDLSDVVWMPAPIGHSTGFNHGVRLALYHGLKLVLQDRWDSAIAALLIHREGCTHTLLAPTFLRDLVRECATHSRDLSTMRLFGCGGAPVARELVTAAATHGIHCLRLYGATEMLVATWNRPGSSEQQKLETDGAPLDGVDIEIRDESGSDLVGEPGELYARSPSGCVGFFGDAERTQATFEPDGWIRSGDVGIVNADRYLTVVGRKKEIIIRGGLNIAPREVEDLIQRLPGVKAVAVIGLPDPRLGETACACVVLVPGALLTFTQMIEQLKADGLATYKLPERLEILDQLPMTVSGKIRKHKLVSAISAAN